MNAFFPHRIRPLHDAMAGLERGVANITGLIAVSWLAMLVSMIAASRTVLAMGPTWSSDEAKATMPQREQRP